MVPYRGRPVNPAATLAACRPPCPQLAFGAPRWAALVLLIVPLAIAPGCSGSGHTRIGGEVTLDGEPIDRGTVRLVATDGQTPSAEAVIHNGRYTAEVMPGEKRVEIQGFRVVGEARRNDDPSAPLEEMTEPIVPPQFNTHSKLTCEIGPRSATHDFHLTTHER